MKRPQNLAIVTLAAALMLAVAFMAPVAHAQEAQDGAKPKATVPEPVHDFGPVAKGAQLVHDFEIRNIGDAPLEISRVAPACGCTVAQYDQVIAPGESGTVHAEVDTSTLAGAVSRGIAVYTNDPTNPTLRLTFNAEVKPQVFIRPGYARYQATLGEKAAGTIKQTLYTGDGVNYEITDVESPIEAMKVEVRDAAKDELIDFEQSTSGPQYVVELTLDHNALPVGPIAHEVVLHTTHPTQKVVRIPISGFIRPTMWVTPEKVELGKIQMDGDEDSYGYGMVLQNFLASPVEITSVETDWDAMKGEALVVNEGHKFHVKMEIEPGMPKGDFQGTVRIRTTSDVMPVVEVPVRGTVL